MSRPASNGETSPSVRGDDNQWTVGGMYHRSDRDAFYRKEDEARRLRDRVTRSTIWLMGHMDGKRFESEEQMRAAVVGLAKTLGYVFDDELDYVITEATATLWQTGRYRQSIAA
jgi:hypothetical protein